MPDLKLSNEGAAKYARLIIDHICWLRDNMAAARKQKKLYLTYGELAEKTGYGVALGAGSLLDLIIAARQEANLPALELFAVNVKGELGGGDWMEDFGYTRADVPRLRQEALDYDWSTVRIVMEQ